MVFKVSGIILNGSFIWERYVMVWGEIKFWENFCKKNKWNLWRLVVFIKIFCDFVVLIGVVELYVIKYMMGVLKIKI